MQLPYIDIILLGLVRFAFWIVFIYAIKRLFLDRRRALTKGNKGEQTYSLIYYSSLLLIILFVLVLVGSYDLFTIGIVFILFFLLRFFRIRKRDFNEQGIERKKRMVLLQVIENLEDGDPILDMNTSDFIKSFRLSTPAIAAITVSVVAVVVRMYLLSIDTYQLSPSWFQELQLVKLFSGQVWFNEDNTLIGHYALINFFSKMTGVSTEVALESFGLLQSFVLTILVFWFTSRLTADKIILPLIAALTFALFFNLSPVNIKQIIHAKATWSALMLALPAMVFVSQPRLLRRQKIKDHFVGMLAVFMAIALINLFVSFILLPPFFLVSILLIVPNRRGVLQSTIFSYVLGNLFVLMVYGMACWYNNADFWLFLKSNLISVETSSTTDYMIMDYQLFMSVLQWICLAVTAIYFVLWRRDRTKWVNPLIFLLYFNVMLLLAQSGAIYFDIDIFNEVLPVFIAIFLGLVLHPFYVLVRTKAKISNMIATPIIITALIVFGAFTQQELLTRSAEKNNTAQRIISGYQYLHENFLPMNYEVVNLPQFQPLSLYAHSFSEYSAFTDTYLDRDSIFYMHRGDKAFFKANPEANLPHSVVVFVYTSSGNNQKIHYTNELMQTLQEQLAVLRARGRTIRPLITEDDFQLLEIVNTKEGTKIKELL